MSVHKKNITFHIISLKGHDLLPHHCARLNFPLVWSYYSHNYPCKNNNTASDIHLKFTKKIPSTCNVLTLASCHHYKNKDGQQMNLISIMCSGWDHKPLKSSIFVDKKHNLEKVESHK